MTIRTQVPALLVTAALCAALAACETAEKVSAEQKTQLDEDVAYQRPALSLPPDYGARPESEDEAQQAQQQAPLTRREQAERRGVSTFAGSGSSPGTVALLKQTHVPEALPNIRELVRRESTIVSHEDRRFVDRLIFGEAIDRGGDGEEIVLQRDDGPMPF